MPIYANIGGAQKPLKELYANINGVQKKIFPLYANIGGVQKNLLGYEWAKYHIVYKKNDSYEENYHLDAPTSYVTVTEGVPKFDKSTGLFRYVYNVNYPLLTKYLSDFTSAPGQQTYLFGNELGAAINDTDLAYAGVKYTYMIFGGSIGTVDTNYNGITFDRLTVYSSSVSTTEHGEFIEYVKSDVETAYPDNGIQDGYWYIRQ